MLFSSMTFLWLFLPIVFVLYRILPLKARNTLLLAASLIFYAWGEPLYILLMLISIGLNYLFGLWIDSRKGMLARKIALIAAIAANLGILAYFKYFDMAVTLFNGIFNASLPLRDIALPIGISFYTFQILSYIIDLYRKEIRVQKNPFKLGLYISFFPQLIAGPIVNYRDVESAISHRNISAEKTAYGIKRFIYGLGKKVIISNQLASAVDSIFAIKLDYMPSSFLWLAAVLYMFQIYYDFSGYSDMAIGLGKMFGFDFFENFNYPYIAASITDFWRRWHISLTQWFRSYLYIPLGGNRKGAFRTVLNIGIVFFLTGLWHGAGLNFIFWGVWHGFFMIIERLFLGKWLEKCPFKFLNRMYTILVVLIGWVMFRGDGMKWAINALSVMFSFTGGSTLPLQMFVGSGTVITLIIAIAFCGIAQSFLPKLKCALYDEHRTGYVQIALLGVIFFVSVTFLVSGTYNPFIYFRF
ncbi:MAG: MBOAT family O-acyltransferase [Oscillospiraceae bacterium]